MGWSTTYVLKTEQPLTGEEERLLKEHVRKWNKRLAQPCEGYELSAGDLFDDEEEDDIVTDQELEASEDAKQAWFSSFLSKLGVAGSRPDVRSGCTKIGHGDQGKQNLVTLFDALTELASLFPKAKVMVSGDFVFPDQIRIQDTGDFRKAIAEG